MMDKAKQELDKLVERLRLIGFDEVEEDPYILTPEEEESVIAHELKRLTEHWQYKLARAGLGKEEIAARIRNERLHEKLNRAEILRRANSNKTNDIWQKEQRKMEEERSLQHTRELRETWTAGKIYQLIRWTAKNFYDQEFLYDDYNKELVECVCYMLTGDERLESKWKHSLKKGLMVRGISGLGKTFTIECVKDNPLNPIKVLSILDIQEELRKNGEFRISLDGRKILYIDDVGTEDLETKYFGNTYNWFKTFIEMNYLKKEIPFNRIIVSTNLNSDQLESRYGYRVRSRIRDMFNVIDMQGEDRRGK